MRLKLCLFIGSLGYSSDGLTSARSSVATLNESCDVPSGNFVSIWLNEFEISEGLTVIAPMVFESLISITTE